MSELKPCPFCGREVSIHGGPEEWTPTFYDPDSGGDPYYIAQGIDAYIRENLEHITYTDEWKAMHVKTLADYCKDVKIQYDVDLDPAYVNYTTEYYWEVS